MLARSLDQRSIKIDCKNLFLVVRGLRNHSAEGVGGRRLEIAWRSTGTAETPLS